MTTTASPPAPKLSAAISQRDRLLAALTAGAVVAAAVTRPLNSVLAFVAAAVALALLAACVGRAVEALGDRLGAAMTGILQSALGNLPELLILIFALRAGLTEVVQATIVGSILANVALVLGVAFIAGGLKHGTQRFPGAAARDLGLSLLLAVAALAVPSLAGLVHSPAGRHERALSVIVSIVLLVAFALFVVFTLGQGRRPQAAEGGLEEPVAQAAEPDAKHAPWPLWLAVAVLATTGVLAALVSDWFVSALSPAIESLGISEAFAGLVIVAIAGNAVENFVGIQLALKNQPEYALQVVLQSPLQIAMVVAPVICLAAPLLGAATFTLVLSPLLLSSLLIAAVIAALVTFDGESTWYEGVVLISLYAVIAASFWWG